MTDPRIEKIARALAMLNVESDDNWKLYIQDAEAALSAIGQMWRKVDDNTPKDREILLLQDDGSVVSGVWINSWYGDRSGAGWILSNLDDEYGYTFEAKMWMEMPPAPEA